MTGPQIDYAAVYRHLPVPVLLLTPELEIADANLAFLQATDRTREELLGRTISDAFLDDPSDRRTTGIRDVSASVRRVLTTGKPDAREFQKYDVEVPGTPGVFARRYWSGVNAPVPGPDGSVMLIASCVEDVTDRMSRFMSALEADAMNEAPGSWHRLA
jgi:PAS domain-containing protein